MCATILYLIMVGIPNFRVSIDVRIVNAILMKQLTLSPQIKVELEQLR